MRSFLACIALCLLNGIVSAQSGSGAIPRPTMLNIAAPTIAPSEPVELTTHEKVSMSTGAISFSVPVVSLPQRGGSTLEIGYVYSGGGYALRQTGARYSAQPSGTGLLPQSISINLQQNTPPVWGLPIHPNLPTIKADLLYTGAMSTCTGNCNDGPLMHYWAQYCMQNWTFTDWDGSEHTFPGTRDCNHGDMGGGDRSLYGQGVMFLVEYPLAAEPWLSSTQGLQYESTDDQHYRLNALNSSDIQVIKRDGTVYHFSGYPASPTWTACYQAGYLECDNLADLTSINKYQAVFSKIVDVNGNTITATSPANVTYGGNIVVTDTVGRKVTVAYSPFSSSSISWNVNAGIGSSTATASLSFSLGNNTAWPYTLPLYSDGTPCKYDTATIEYVAQYNGMTPPIVEYLGPTEQKPRTYTLTLQNSSTYTFDFDVAANLVKAQYPTGGYTRYDYGYQVSPQPATFGDVTCQAVPMTYLYAKHECSLASGNCSEAAASTTANSCTAGHTLGGESTTCYSGLANFQGVTFTSSGVSGFGGGPVTVTDPLGQKSIINSSLTIINVPTSCNGGCSTYSYQFPSHENSRQIYSGSTLLRTVSKEYGTYGASNTPCGGDANSLCTESTTYNDASPNVTIQTLYTNDSVSPFNPVKEVLQKLDSSGNVVEVLKTTTTTWNHSGIYADAWPSSGVGHILDKPSAQTVTESAQGKSNSVSISYDSVGNLYSTTVSGTGTGSYKTTYDGAISNHGSPTTSTDAGGYVTTYKYDDSWEESSCAPSGSSNSYVTSTIRNLQTGTGGTKSLTTKYSYYSCTGQLASITSPDGHKTTYKYDSLGRVREVDYPDSGKTQIAPDDTPPMSLTTTMLQNASQEVSSSVTFDGFGREEQETLPSGSLVLYGYDSLGRKCVVSNLGTQQLPSNGLSCSASENSLKQAEATDGLTYTAYDVLNRPTRLTHPDGTYISTSYAGLATTVTNENKVATVRTNDVYGRLVSVNEPSAKTGVSGMATSYTYDGFNNLIKVSQNGTGSTPMVRTFTYDGLSRLVCSSNPETNSGTCPSLPPSSYVTGTTSYGYDALSRLMTKQTPAVNVTAGSTNQTLGYCYDGAGRLTYKFWSSSFSCTSPSGYAAQYLYDNVALGRLDEEISFINGKQVFDRKINTYDSMGRVLKEAQTLAYGLGKSYVSQYQYDLMGHLVASTDGSNGVSGNVASSGYPCAVPSGVTAWTTLAQVNCYDSAGRLSSITSNWKQYPTSIFSVPTTGYNAAGLLTNWTQGPTLSSVSALTISRQYDNRLRLTNITATGQVP